MKPGASWQHLKEDLQTLLTLALGTAVQPRQMKLLDVESLEDASNATTAVLEELAALDAQYNYIMHPYSIKVGQRSCHSRLLCAFRCPPPPPPAPLGFLGVL